MVSENEGPPDIPEIDNLRLIGSGGFADVYSGIQTLLGRAVAVKVFRSNITDRGAVTQFKAECKAIGGLPQELDVVPIHYTALVPGKGQPYLVMNLCSHSLQDRLGQGALTPAEVARIGYKMALALASVHRSGLVHRDITPRNILFSESGRPLLADFGLTVRTGQQSSQDYATWEHAAPETWKGESTARSDIYGLGSTLYTALAGRPPFAKRPGETPLALRSRVLTESAPAIEGVPPGLMSVIARMLAKDTASRMDADTAAMELSAFCQEPAFPAPRPDISRSAPLTAGRHAITGDWPLSALGDPDLTGHRPELFDVEPPAPKQKRKIVPWIAVGSGALLVAVVTVSLIAQQDHGPAKSAAPPSTAVTSGAAPAASIVLAELEDKSGTVRLNWTGPAGLNYAVVIAAEGAREPQTVLVNQASTHTAKVDPGLKYCFAIQGTDGNQVYESRLVGIRGAVCNP